MTGFKKKNNPGRDVTCRQGTGAWEWAGEISYLAFFMCPIFILTELKQN